MSEGLPEDRMIGVEDPDLDDAALEALALAYATPPAPKLRQRVLDAARAETVTTGGRRSHTRWRVVGAVAAMLVLVLGGLLARETELHRRQVAQVEALRQANAELTARLETQERTLAGLRESLDAQARVLRILGAPRTLSAALGPKEGFGGGGRVHVDAETGEGAVVLTGLPPPGADKVYELWALRGDAPPEPAGLLGVAGQSVYTTQVARLERPTDVTAFAVSIEPAGGSKSPTGPIVLVGPVRG